MDAGGTGRDDMQTQSRRELNKLRCRQRILKASRQLFSGKGYEETTIEDVAERAEISKATLYNYFPSKESLLIGIAEAELADIRRLIAQDLRDEARSLLKLRRVMEVFVVDSIPYISLSRKITYLNSCEESPLYATRLTMMKIMRQLVEEAQDQGDFRADVPADDIVDMVMGIYLMAQFEWSHIADYTEAFCIEKLRRFFDHMLSGVYA